MTDWAMIQRYYGCDPGKLTMPQWFASLERIGEVGAVLDGFDDKAERKGRKSRRRFERRALSDRSRRQADEPERKRVALSGGPYDGQRRFVAPDKSVLRIRGTEGNAEYHRKDDDTFAFAKSLGGKMSAEDAMNKLGVRVG